MLSCVWLFAIPWTIHGILQARIRKWVAFPFSRGSSQPRDRTQVSCIAGRFFTSWAMREAQCAPYFPSLCPLLIHTPLSWLIPTSLWDLLSLKAILNSPAQPFLHPTTPYLPKLCRGLSSVFLFQFSPSVMSKSLRPHGLQHTRLLCPSPTPGVCSNSCPSSWWCHPTISSSVAPLSSCLQSFPASGSLPVSQFFTSGGQSTGASASAAVLPMNNPDWFPLEWLLWSPCCRRDSEESSPTPQFKSINSSALSFLYCPTLTSNSLCDY